jgi:glutamate synthase (NADPH/NADH) large chain
MMEGGLYSPTYEHDACGIGMVVNIHGNKSHALVENALVVLENMRHRGAEGADNKTGDGAGILLQIPHEFILLNGIPVPEKGKYGTGIVFLPKDDSRQEKIISVIIEEIERAGLRLMHIREVPTDSSCLGQEALSAEPDIKQIFVTGIPDDQVSALDRVLYKIRKKIERRIEDKDFYICSLSSKDIIYKGMLSSMQLRHYYPDLTNPYFTSGLALVHSRFSTNTFPTWSLAQPFRLLCHNGEINTIRGNREWMKARESVLSSDALGDVSQITPVIQPGMSDSASLDNVLEFLVMSGLSLPQAMAIMVPESFNDKNPISEDLKAFYEYHSIIMEPWDGPAALLFSDGRYAGGMLDRNGLRPARYAITKNDTMVVASEVGVLDFDPSDVVEKGCLQPGKILLVDTKEGRIYRDEEIKDLLASEHPYRKWLNSNRIQLEKLRSGRKVENNVPDLLLKELGFGFNEEDIENVIVPMAVNAQEPTASMGNDTPLAVLSKRPQLFFNYFRQQFAQVTNPAIDSIRENLVMSLSEYIGRVGTGILHPSEENCKMVRLPHPILTNSDLDILCNIRYKGFNTVKLKMSFVHSDGKSDGYALRQALDGLCRDAVKSVEDGCNYIILSDKDLPAGEVPIPSLLAVSAVHQYLINAGKRVQTALIVESGEIREVMHAALLLGYGASALCPYMTYAILDDLVKRGKIQENYETAQANYIKAVKKGLYKIMAKMGISTIRSYRGARIFESIGLGESLLRDYFGTEISSIGGVNLDAIAGDAIRFQQIASKADNAGQDEGICFLPNVGQLHYRKNGVKHAWNPETITTLQLATRRGEYDIFKKFTHLADDKEDPIFIRDFFDFKRNPIDIEKVESEEAIMRHFVTSAMSFGALSKEAHEAMAMAMNSLGLRSNTGEGGEDDDRFHATVEGISLNSKTKQVASGRFGVTAEYLMNAEELQIKVAQGAKPGEGGQLPGFKVNGIIARTRHSIPGISLISPPPHHDIYSIEDLAQLIFDLKNVNPRAAISVKLVAESGVGTIAAGVAKAKADLIVISGAEGGTGASPASSIRFAGIPAEIGLAEAQQTLVKNGLRCKVRLQVDGQLKTGRDVILMALLGAEEFSFGTAALIVLGCVMMRKCNLNTCPMGVATQDAKLRGHFRGNWHYLVNYFRFLAHEVREYLAEMGYTSLNEIVGHTELIVQRDDIKAKAPLDFSRLLHKEEGTLHFATSQSINLDDVLDKKIIQASQKAIDDQEQVSLDFLIKNTDRAVGAMLSGVIAGRYGAAGLPANTINIRLTGSAGQSFGAFLMKGVSFSLEGEANDYFGKGLSGGSISILPQARSTFAPEDNVIAGNTGLYGATSGEIFINGRVGQRFAVRNSGAVAVVEGAGDHCCEYMTGGRVVVLGKTGRNFAAGMSGGIAYVWDENHDFDYFCNMDMVEIGLVEENACKRELLELIRRHYQHTGSILAKRMLDDWGRYQDDFIQVTPIEYKRVIQEQQVQKLQQKIADLQRDY